MSDSVEDPQKTICQSHTKNEPEFTSEKHTANIPQSDKQESINCPPQEDNIVPESTKSWTKTQKFTIATMALVNFAAMASFSIISPFFPKEAAKKGASSTEVGFIFGVFEFIIFSTAPLFGKFLPKIGSKFMFVSGIAVSGSCAILFGFLDECPDGVIYVVMCFCTRSIEALGTSMFVTASFAIISSEFHDQVAMIFGLLETFSGLGLMVGPPLGGALYQYGGYKLPFMVMGSFLLLCATTAFFILPKPEDQLPHTGSMLRLLRISSIPLGCTTIIISAGALGFLDPIFAQHLDRNFHLSPFWIGVIFLIGPGVYAIVAPFFGYIVDKKKLTKSLMCTGGCVTCVSYFLLGPSPLLPWIPLKLWTTIIGQICLGLGVGMSFVPVFADFITSAEKSGLPNNFETYGLISGLFNSCFSLGAFMGPTAGGYLNEVVGFRWSTTVVSFASLFVSFLYVLYWIHNHISCCALEALKENKDKKYSNVGEKEPLLKGVLIASYTYVETSYNIDW